MIDFGKLLFPDFPRAMRNKKLRNVGFILVVSLLISLLLVAYIIKKTWSSKHAEAVQSGIDAGVAPAN